MKYPDTHTRLRSSLLVTLLVYTVSSVYAQQVQPATAADPDAARNSRTGSTTASSSEVTKLSPFVVKASPNDIGYYAENTLAGSRLSTNIGDLGASITVVTRQQMLDTASVDINDVFLYEANTEGTENYTAFTFNDQGGVSDTNQTSPESANRIRGIGAADHAHNYYPTIDALPFDVYNTESVEINRGPNSLLFGLGSAAGIVNQSSATANLQRNFAQLTGRYGTEGAYRTSFSVNRAIIPGKLGIYAAGLYDSRAFERKPSYDIARRGYASIGYRPFSKTSIQASYERYSSSSRLPNTVNPQDGISDWRAAGSPTWNPLTFTVTRDGVATKLPNSNLNNIPGLMVMFNARPAMYYDQGGPLFWMQQGLTNGVINNAYPLTLPQNAISASNIMKLYKTTLPLYRPIAVTDQSIYDWSSINITSGNWSKRDADVYNVELNQELLPDLFLQAGWYREKFDRKGVSYNANQPLVVDVDTVLMDGTPNPYLGRPYYQFSGRQSLEEEPQTNDNYRVSLAYSLDLTRKPNWVKWLGSHRFFAIADQHELTTTDLPSNEVVMDNHSWVNPAARYAGAPGSIGLSTTLDGRFYLGGADGNVAYDPGYMAFGTYSLPLRNAARQKNGTYVWTDEPTLIGAALNSNTHRSTQLTRSLTLGVQSSFLNDRIVPTIGFRRDGNKSKASQGLALDPSTGLLVLDGLDNYGTPQVTYGNTSTFGVVVKPLKWLSFSYDQSRNFTPSAYKVDIYGNPLPLPTGRGKDYGVRFNLFKDRLYLNVNYYNTVAEHARGTPADAVMFRVSRFETDFIGWANTAAVAELGSGASSSAIADRVAQITQLPVGYTPPAQGTIASSSIVESKGYEIQLIFNPVKNWNMKATAGKQRTTYTQVAPEYEAYTAPRLPVWQSAKDSTGADFWNADAVPDLASPVDFWNKNIATPMTLAKALEGKRTQGQHDWQANFISTYRVIDGPLGGMDFGGGVRWQDRAIIGYLGGTPDSDGVVRTLDVNQAVYASTRPSFDFWISRTFRLPKLLGENTRMKLQLNVRNAFEKGNWLQPIAVNPDGVASAYRIVDPRQWYLTATFDF